jgi:hypothetical protein
MSTTITKTTARWIAALTMAAGLGTAIATGSAVASADDNTTQQVKVRQIQQDITVDKAKLCDAACHKMDDYIRG